VSAGRFLLDLDRTAFHADRLDLFWAFVCERQAIWHRRFVLRRRPPWTDDPVLRVERFTNVYRELDPGTRYVFRRILEPEAPRPDKVFNVMLCRLVGRAETHAALGFQRLATFDAAALERGLKGLRDEAGRPPFTAAYTVSAYASMGSRDKVENVARLFAVLHRGFGEVYARIEASRSAAEVHAVLGTAYGFGNFLAYQVLVDLLYPLEAYGGAPLLPYSHDDWASAGPGARRGIAMLLPDGARVLPLDVMRWLHRHQRKEFDRLDLAFAALADGGGNPIPISLANIQNCLCEFHKYVKIAEGTGRGRRKFVPRDADQVQLGLDLGWVEG
jgi:hypothetical protein